MLEPKITKVDNPGPLKFPASVQQILSFFLLVGVVTFLLALKFDPQRAWYSLLFNHFFFLCLGLAGIFFTALQHATRSMWSVTVRRVAEALTSYLPIAIAFVVLIIIVGSGKLYHWINPEVLAGHGAEPTTHAAHNIFTPYLNLPFFSLRQIGFLAVWILFGTLLVRNSLKQDQSGDGRLSRENIYLSTAFIPIFAFTFTFACFDLLMSLEPGWYSTIFGVYCFAGLFQLGLSVIIILVILLKQKGPLAGVVNTYHLKDLANLLFAFSVFMAYIGFSQFMLIWYANLPEETIFFLKRFQNGWVWVAVLLTFLKFFIPFFGLMALKAKANEKWLIIVASIVILGEWLDIYWIVAPMFKATLVIPNWVEIGIFLGFAGLFGMAVSRFFQRNSVLAYNDPRILESVNWEG